MLVELARLAGTWFAPLTDRSEFVEALRSRGARGDDVLERRPLEGLRECPRVVGEGEERRDGGFRAVESFGKPGDLGGPEPERESWLSDCVRSAAWPSWAVLNVVADVRRRSCDASD